MNWYGVQICSIGRIKLSYTYMYTSILQRKTKEKQTKSLQVFVEAKKQTKNGKFHTAARNIVLLHIWQAQYYFLVAVKISVKYKWSQTWHAFLILKMTNEHVFK